MSLSTTRYGMNKNNKSIGSMRCCIGEREKAAEVTSYSYSSNALLPPASKSGQLSALLASHSALFHTP